MKYLTLCYSSQYGVSGYHLEQHRSSLPRARCFLLLLCQMGPTGYPVTSVRNFYYSLSNNPEERGSNLT